MSHPADHSDPDMDDFAQAEADRDSARQEVATLKAALAESDIRIAGVEAERDHYRVALAEVTRERDALLAGKWAGPWDSLTHFAFVRRDSRGSAVTPVRLAHERAAWDAKHEAAGWYLAKSPEEGT